MKISERVMNCELSPIRKFTPLADAARARGISIYPLNIGQPDVETPREFFEAARAFSDPVLEYAPSAGIPAYLDAVHGYYERLGTAPGAGLHTGHRRRERGSLLRHAVHTG